MHVGGPGRIGCLMKFPERPNAGMNALCALEHLTSDAHVRHIAITDNRSRHGNGPLGVVGRFAESPLVFAIPAISSDDDVRRTLEPLHAIGVPAADLVAGQVLGLLADGVAGRNAFETGDDPFSSRPGHVAAPGRAIASAVSAHNDAIFITATRVVRGCEPSSAVEEEHSRKPALDPAENRVSLRKVRKP